MSRPVRVLYVVPQSPASSDAVFQAQVLGQAGALTRAGGFECMVLAGERSPEKAAAAMEMPQISRLSKGLVLPLLPQEGHYLALRRAAGVIVAEAMPQIAAFAPDYVYIRSYVNLALARRIAARTAAQTVFDVRGLTQAEKIEQNEHVRGLARRAALHARAALIGVLERRAVRRADKVLAVSHALAHWMRRHTGRGDIEVVPCCVDAETFKPDLAARAQVRRDLAWAEDDPVVVYSGSMSVQQRIEETLRLLAQAQRMNPRIKVLLLTYHQAQAMNLAKRCELAEGSFAVRSAPNSQVPRWLSAADAAILLRQNILMNNVASPIKVGEYLACGLPIICSRGIGDHSGLVERTGAGVLLEDAELASAGPRKACELLAQACGGAMRDRARAVALENLAWSAHVDTYRRVYSIPA
jgi:glycosyltransferase involved in cell wall biosynthesis